LRSAGPVAAAEALRRREADFLREPFLEVVGHDVNNAR
jgi:hypothetical protein